MATEFCVETREDISDSCHRFYDRNKADLDSWYDRKKSDCRSFCTCNGWPWRWPCCIARAACLAGIAIAYGVAVAAIAVAYAACLAASIIVHVVCYIVVWLITIVLELFELILVIVFRIIRFFAGIICGIGGFCCKTATVSGTDFSYPTGYEDDDIVGRPENSDRDMFASRTESPTGLRMQYLGTNSLHISDGEIDILIDPYFTRPSISTAAILFCKTKIIESNREIIEKVLDGAHITKVDAIVLTHSHFDHALDVVEVARYLADQNGGTYPQIIGSRSTFHICRGGGIPDENITIVDQFKPEQETYSFGRFDIQLLRGKHINVPFGGTFFSGTITTDLTPPYNLFDLKEGGIFSIYIRHEWGNILNLGSANFLKGALDSVNNVDFLILGIAGLNVGAVHIFDDFHMYNKDNFYNEVVVKTGPGHIYFSHWDDYYEQLDREYPLWYRDSYESRDFFISKNPDLAPLFLPIGGYIDLPDNSTVY